MDEIQWIRDYAENARTAARQVLQWRLDRLRLTVGLVEIVERDDIRPGDRLVPSHTDEYGQAWCVFVRDVPTRHDEPIYADLLEHPHYKERWER